MVPSAYGSAPGPPSVGDRNLCRIVSRAVGESLLKFGPQMLVRGLGWGSGFPAFSWPAT